MPMLLGIILSGLMEVLSLSSCQSVAIKDAVFTGSKGIDGGRQVHTLTNVPGVDISFEQWITIWNDLSHPQICTEVDNFTAYKADIETLCSYSTCTYDQIQIQQRLLRFSAWAQSLKKPAEISQ